MNHHKLRVEAEIATTKMSGKLNNHPAAAYGDRYPQLSFSLVFVTFKMLYEEMKSFWHIVIISYTGNFEQLVA